MAHDDDTLTVTERMAIKSGADLLQRPSGTWGWRFAGAECGGYGSSDHAAGGFLRWYKGRSADTATKIAQRKAVKITSQTVSGIPMQVSRASLRPALELAVEAFERIAKETPELQEQFRNQANEVRGWLIAEDFADYIVLKD